MGIAGRVMSWFFMVRSALIVSNLRRGVFRKSECSVDGRIGVRLRVEACVGLVIDGDSQLIASNSAVLLPGSGRETTRPRSPTSSQRRVFGDLGMTNDCRNIPGPDDAIGRRGNRSVIRS